MSVQAQFVASVTSGQAPLRVQFTDQTVVAPANAVQSPPPDEYRWDFGDGRGDTVTDPTHVFEGEGTFTVTLTVTSHRDTSGPETGTHTATITVTPAPRVEAAFTFTALPGGFSVGDSVSFSNTSTVNNATGTTFEWDFGEGWVPNQAASVAHTFNLPGSYMVRLRILDSAGRELSSSSQSVLVRLLQDDAQGKWVKLDVPVFRGNAGATPMRSYLRLGAIEPDILVPATRGRVTLKDLKDSSGAVVTDNRTDQPLKVAKVTKSAGNQDLAEANWSNLPPDHGEDLAAKVVEFWDDNRDRGSAPHKRNPDPRQTESEQLHTKGGWRDHTDGNRITTTRGDKVEVIGGNYRMVVLGRSQHASAGEEGYQGAWWEAAGGHMRDSCDWPGAITEIKWIQKNGDGDEPESSWNDNGDGGTWRVVEKTEVGDTDSYFRGYQKEVTVGRTESFLHGDCYSYQGKHSDKPEDWPGPDAKLKSRNEEDGFKSVERIYADVDSFHKGDLNSFVNNPNCGEVALFGAKGGYTMGGIDVQLAVVAKLVESFIGVTKASIDAALFGIRSITMAPNITSVNMGMDIVNIDIGAVANVVTGAAEEITLGPRSEKALLASLVAGSVLIG